LQQVFHGLGASRAAGGPPPSDQATGGDEDVIDADFTVS
jgi:hypothetical protein